MLPKNALRPTADHWQDAWGDRAVPTGYGHRVLELGQYFELKQLGANLGDIPPGGRGGPLHYHLFEEEVFIVLEGELVVRELAPGAVRYTEYALRAGELVVYPAGTGLAHQSRNETDADVRMLNLSDFWKTDEIAVYPDSGKTLLRALGALGVFAREGSAADHIAAARAAADAREIDQLELGDRPAWVQGPATLEERDLGSGVHGRPLSRTAGAASVFVNRDRLTPGSVSGPLHWHTADEELLVVLEGRPTLRQVHEDVETRDVLEPGDVVCWKAGEKIAHQLIAAPDADAVVLVVGTSRPEDIVVFPEEDRVAVRALDQSGSMDRAGYWAGEGH